MRPSLQNILLTAAIAATSTQVAAISIENENQTQASDAGQSSENSQKAVQSSVLNGLASMATEDGSITIPLTKVSTSQGSQETGLAQASGQYESEHFLSQTNAEMFELNTEINTSNGDVGVLLENTKNVAYQGEIYLGSGDDLQPIRALFDTGSANPWILEKCAVNSYSNNWYFDIGETKTVEEGGHFKDVSNGVTTTINFGSGYVQGYFVNDTLTLGDPDDTDAQLKVADWTFGLVDKQTTFTDSFDAIIGLAYPQFAEKGVTPIMDALMKNNILAKNIFSFSLSMNADEPSLLKFGAIDENAYTGEIKYYDVKHKLFWSIQLDDVLIDGKSTGYCTKENANCLVTPDSGTSAITFPPGFYGQFSEEYGDTIDCTEEDILNFGSMTFVIEGDNYTLPSHHWIQRTESKGSTKGGFCASHVVELNVNQKGLENLFIAGDVFMQLYYTVFDRDSDQVGFGHAKHSKPEILMQYNEGGTLASVNTLSDYDY